MTVYQYRLHQVTPEGMFRSSESYKGTMTHAIQAVVGGWDSEHQPRAAIEEGPGPVIYSVDKDGQATAASVKLFSTVELAGA